MRRNVHIAAALWILLFILWIPVISLAQSPFDPEYHKGGAAIRDHLEVFTDRTIYVTGETIRFRADYFREGLPGDQPWSSVVYAELMTGDGSTVVVSKWAVHEGHVTGTLPIPRKVLTGRYLLRCYTRWMRNRGPEGFSYTMLNIINPFRREMVVDEGSKGTDRGAGQDPGTGTGPAISRNKGNEAVRCFFDKTRYHPGEWVRLTLQAPEDLPGEGVSGCLTAAPEGSVEPIADYGTGKLVPAPEPFRLQYLPDLGEAFTLSGMVVKGEGTEAGEAAITFSLLGPEPDLITAKTDSWGRFAVQIPFRKSDQAFLVVPRPGEDVSLEVRIDQDLDSRKPPFSTGRFRLTEKEQEVATWMAIQWQIMDAYLDPDTTGETGDIALNRTLPFYGSDVEQTILKDYVNLPTLEEIFVNLVPDVNVVRRKGTLDFSIVSDNRSIGFYRPLVMVDYIPVFDFNTLLAKDPRDFERIEVIRDVYVKGTLAFGGVISLFTRNGDMAGLDLPEGSYFFDMTPPGNSAGNATENTQENEIKVTGEVSAAADQTETSRIPDLRNTVFWDADLRLAPGSQQDILFRAPGRTGDYTVLFRGAVSRGQIVSGNGRFTVQRPESTGNMP